MISCTSIGNQNVYEIQNFLQTIPQETQKDFLEFYISNKTTFWNAVLGNNEYKIKDLENELINYKLESGIIQTIINSTIKYSAEYRKVIMIRDSTYTEGVECLSKILKDDVEKFEKEIEIIENQVISKLSTSQTRELLKRQKKQLTIITKRKEKFYEADNMTNGEIGKNITTYNQLSFDLIKRIHCVEYDRGFKNEFYTFSSSIFKSNKELIKLAEKYAIIESKLVNTISQPNCKKRIGIIRYYDGLNSDQIIKAQRANLLLNTANYIKNAEDNK